MGFRRRREVSVKLVGVLVHGVIGLLVLLRLFPD